MPLREVVVHSNPPRHHWLHLKNPARSGVFDVQAPIAAAFGLLCALLLISIDHQDYMLHECATLQLRWESFVFTAVITARKGSVRVLVGASTRSELFSQIGVKQQQYQPHGETLTAYTCACRLHHSGNQPKP